MARRGWNRVLGALAVFAALAVSGFAEASVCSDLTAQLRAVDGGGSQNSSAYRRAATQAAQQRSQLNQAIGQARQAGCMGFSLFRGRSPYCPAIMAQVNQLQAAVNASEARMRQASGGGGGFGSSASRGGILQAMATNGCMTADPGTRSASSGGGSSRGAMCVRTCDGYAFPLGGQVSRSGFDEAQQSCQARCPGTEVQLFTSRGSSQADMVSPTGERYGDLANAFAYQRNFVANCGCNPPGGWPTEVVLAPTSADPVVPLPLPSPVATEDPETIANRAGALVPEPVTRPDEAGPQVAAAESADARRVRLVGPSYYYAGAATMVIGRPAPGSAAATTSDDGATPGDDLPSPETTASTLREDPPSQF